MAVRLAPVEIGLDGIVEDAADAVTSDRWWRLVPHDSTDAHGTGSVDTADSADSNASDAAWLAYAGHTGVAFTIPAASVDSLWADLDKRLLLPVTPARIAGIEVLIDERVSMRLQRGRDGWIATDGDGTPLIVDNTAITAWLTVLAGLERGLESPASELNDADSSVGELRLLVPQAGGPPRELTVVCERFLSDGRAIVRLDDDGNTLSEPIVIMATQALVLPSAERFAPLEGASR